MRGTGLALAVLLLTACGKDATPAVKPADSIAVTLATAAPAGGTASLSITGTVRLKRETLLGFSSAGRIAAISVREGDRVRAGQLLARLDPTGLDAASASARAEAVRSAAELARMQALIAKGWVTRARVDDAAAAAAAARSRVTQASFDVRLGSIVAPASGVILRRAAEPGQIVAAGTPVLTIGEVGSGYVLRLPVSDGDLARLRTGQLAAVTLPALSPNAVAGTIGEIGARGDERTGTFQVEVRLPPLAGLRSGLIGTALVRFGGQGPATGPVTVPASAVFAARADQGFVFVYRPASKTVASRMVELGAIDDRGIVIAAGLQAGEAVVRSGVDRLRDGTRVAAQ